VVSKTPAVFLALLLSAVFVLAAQAQLVALQDAFVTLSTPSANYGSEETLSVAAGGIGACAASEISYLRFDLGDLVDGPVGSAALVLETTFAASSNSGQLVLYAAADTQAGGGAPWQENTLTWDNRPSLEGTALASVPIPAGSGGAISMQSQALAALINQEASFGGIRPGDDVLSLALLIEACTGLNSVVRFASSEHGSAAGPSLTFSPPLRLFLPVVR
jgi:hypothetical protein